MHLGTSAAALSAVGLSASLVLASPVTAAASGPTPRDGTVAFSATSATRGDVGRLDGVDRSMAQHHDVTPVVTAATAPIAVGDGATAIGVSWSGAPPSGVLQWRFRSQAGAIGAWAELPTGAHGPDAGSAEAQSARRASDPVLTTDPGSVELRLIGEAAPSSKVVATVDSADAPSPQSSRLAKAAQAQSPEPAAASGAARAAASGSTPTIATRAAWGGR